MFSNNLKYKKKYLNLFNQVGGKYDKKEFNDMLDRIDGFKLQIQDDKYY